MPPFSKVCRIAETWIAVMTDGGAEIAREAVQAKPYGWIFYYQSSAYLRDPSDISATLAGNAPFMVDRVNGELRVLGTAPELIEQRLSEYERGLPKAVFQSKPEPPTW